MVYLLPTKNEILIWDKRDIIISRDSSAIPKPTYRIRRPFSFWKYRNLRNRSIIIGFVGPRGSGKSVGAARTIIMDYLLRGKNVWSNMDIGFNLISGGRVVEIRTKPLEKLSLVQLDQVFSNGVIYVDEVNLMAEARRSMSQSNLMFSYILQQLRKRRLSIIWSAQSENHCDDRLRFQTDIFITCEDVSISKPNCDIGAYSRWRAHDFSGIVKGKVESKKGESIPFFSATMWNKPWWNMYSTWQLQEVGIGESNKVDPRQEEATNIAREIAKFIGNEGLTSVKKRLIWRKWGVDDINMMKLVGRVLSKDHGIITGGNGGTKYVIEDLEESLA